MIRLLLTASILLSSSLELQAGFVVFSDDFEAEPTPPIPPSYIENYDDFQKWDVIGSGVDLVGAGGTFPSRIDSIMVDLDGTSGSTLITKETFDLNPGVVYTLTFDLGGPVGGATLDTVVVSLGTAFSETITILEHDPFVTFTRTFKVSQATTGKLSFSDLGADSNGAFLDDVSLEASAVPEPASIALFGLGSLGIGFIVRRRKETQRIFEGKSV